MAFKDMFKKTYEIMCYCNNCSVHSQVKIPKGVSVIQFMETGSCPACNCISLVVDYKQIDEFKPRQETKLVRIGRRDIQQPMQRAQIPQPRPSNRPANSVPPQRLRPVEPDFSIAPERGVFRNTAEDVDFWEGTKKAAERTDERERRRR